MASLQKSVSGEDMNTESSQSMIDQMKKIMTQKAKELFRVCDQEEKGYIIKIDMQRLRAELPVSPDQLDVVFDSLDTNCNGYLTVPEFINGFGNFIGLRSPVPSREYDVEEDHLLDSSNLHESVTDADLGEKMFVEMLSQIGASNIFQDEDVIKAMWLKLHREEPSMTDAFEDFISRIAEDIKRSKVDFQSLEAALMSKNNEHEEEVRKLYEEMELQLKQELDKILTEEKVKGKQVRGEMETKLKEKEKQLQEISVRHQELEEKVSQLNKVETVTKQENERLQKEKNQLEELLTQSQENLEASRSYIQLMHLQDKEEKKERARSCDDILARGDHKNKNFTVTFYHDLQAKKPQLTRGQRAVVMLSEGIAIERESLMKQLDILKDINKRLRDDKDEAEAKEARFGRPREMSRSNSTPVQGRSYISKFQYYPAHFPGGGKGQQS